MKKSSLKTFEICSIKNCGQNISKRHYYNGKLICEDCYNELLVAGEVEDDD